MLVHDFPTDAEGKAIPYGVYDMARNEAWVSVGWDHDTPAFAVASIRHWWHQMGCGAYPEATTLMLILRAASAPTTVIFSAPAGKRAQPANEQRRTKPHQSSGHHRRSGRRARRKLDCSPRSLAFTGASHYYWLPGSALDCFSCAVRCL